MARLGKLDVVMAISVAVIWGLGFVVAKAGMSHFSPIFLMALRFLVTAICLIFFFPPPLSLWRPLFLIAFVSAAVQYSLTFTGVSGINASTASLLVQLEVPFALLLARVFLGERMSFRQGVGIIIAFVGAILIIGEPKLNDNLGYAAMVVGGAFAWAVGQVMIKRLGEIGGFVLISAVAAFATPQLFIASYLFESGQWDQLQTASAGAWASVLYLGLVMTALAYAFWYHLIGRYSVNQVMPFLLLLPVIAVAGGIVFLDESLTLKIFIGGVLAVAGVGIITVQPGARASIKGSQGNR